MPHILVDLDGTLAEYHGWSMAPGKPIANMVHKVRGFLLSNIEVRIFTARVAASGKLTPLGTVDDEAWAAVQRANIDEWCTKVFGFPLPVTATKDFDAIAIYDDRAIPVWHNKGRVQFIGENVLLDNLVDLNHV